MDFLQPTGILTASAAAMWIFAKVFEPFIALLLENMRTSLAERRAAAHARGGGAAEFEASLLRRIEQLTTQVDGLIARLDAKDVVIDEWQEKFRKSELKCEATNHEWERTVFELNAGHEHDRRNWETKIVLIKSLLESGVAQKTIADALK